MRDRRRVEERPAPERLARVEREAHARRVVAQREQVSPVEGFRQLLVRRAAEPELALPGAWLSAARLRFATLRMGARVVRMVQPLFACVVVIARPLASALVGSSGYIWQLLGCQSASALPGVLKA